MRHSDAFERAQRQALRAYRVAVLGSVLIVIGTLAFWSLIGWALYRVVVHFT